MTPTLDTGTSGGGGGGTADADDELWEEDTTDTSTSTDTTVTDTQIDNDDGHDLNLGDDPEAGGGGYTGDSTAEADVIDDPSDDGSIIVTGDVEDRQQTRDEEVFPAITEYNQTTTEETEEESTPTETVTDTAEGRLAALVAWAKANPKKAGAAVVAAALAAEGSA